jgi:hypothetical protein
MCTHQPPCPPAYATDRDAARILVAHPEQGWNLLCNGVIAFDDGGDLLPYAPQFPAQRAVRFESGHADAA